MGGGGGGAADCGAGGARVRLDGVTAAVIAAAAFGVINATLGNIIKFFAWPARILTLGLASLVINAVMFWLTTAVVPGFRVDGFVPAFLGALLLSVLTGIAGWMIGDGRDSSKKAS